MVEAFEVKNPVWEIRVKETFAEQGVMGLLGAQLHSMPPGYCEISLAYKPQLSQQNGFFHGGIIGTIADTAGGFAGFSLMPANSSVLTVEYKLNLMAPAEGEKIVARAKVVKSGRTLTITDTDVFVIKNGKETQCAKSLQTLISLVSKS
jgi:uncharacterized protein (TIGR00369 family)